MTPRRAREGGNERREADEGWKRRGRHDVEEKERERGNERREEREGEEKKGKK